MCELMEMTDFILSAISLHNIRISSILVIRDVGNPTFETEVNDASCN